MREEIEQTFNEKILALGPNDPTFEVRKYLINIERAENLDMLEKINNPQKKSNKKQRFFDIDETSICLKN